MNLSHSRFRKLRSEAAVRLRMGPGRPTFQSLEPQTDAFWDEVRRLPLRQAQAFALRYLEDLPVADIAAVMATAEGTVRALLHQGCQRLERQLTAKGLVEP